MKKFIKQPLRKVSLGILASAFVFSQISLAQNWENLERAFLKEHRLFQKVIVGKSQWNSAFCEGNYHYRVLLQTQVTSLKILVNDDGSVRVKARFSNPYVGFQGNYQGFYSFCFPVSGWSGISLDYAEVESVIHFSEGLEGRVILRTEVESVYLGKIATGALSKDWEEKLTTTLNEGIAQVWASSWGDWLESQISHLLNENLPINL